jgi:4-amino-4-deoxy-L-arabinose transferase-like glycosyltransferase
MANGHRASHVVRSAHRMVARTSVGGWSFTLFMISLVVALSFTFLAFPRLLESTSGLDSDGYGQTGQILYDTGHFDTVTQAPLYPAFIAGVSRVCGSYSIPCIQTAQAILAALTCVILYLLFRVVLDAGIAKYAGLACAVYPMTVWYVPRLWTETFLTFVLAVFSLSLFRALRRPTWHGMCLCGLAAGVVALTKGIGIVFFVLVPLLLLVRFRGAGIRWAALFVLSASVLVSPWTYRNFERTGRFIPIHATSGYNFYLGNGFTRHWLDSPLSYVDLKAMTVNDMQALSEAGLPADPVELDDVLMSAAVAQFKADPLLLPRKLLTQCLTFWFLAGSPSKSILTGALQAPVVILAFVGVVLALRRRSWALALLVPIAGIMGVAVTVYAFARLSGPIMPYMIGLAAYGVAPLFGPIGHAWRHA